MANTALTATVIAKEALAIMENELGWLNNLHRAYEDEFTQKVNGYNVGDTISIRRPADPTVRVGATLSVTDVIEGKVDLTVDQQIGTDFQFTSTDLTLKIENLSERVIKPGMMNIINYMAADCLGVMYKGINNWVGTPGTNITTFAGFAKGMERLNVLSVPAEDRSAILSPTDHVGMLGDMKGLYVGDMAKGAYRQGELGMVAGINTYMSQVVPTHTTGARGGTPLVNGAAQNVTYDTVKNTFSQSLLMKGGTASVTGWAKAGDVFTIAGVFMVNARTKASTGILQQFVITADANTDGSGNATLTITPPIISAAGQHHQTVTAAPADSAVMTFTASAATAYTQNLVFHKNTMALAVVPMMMPTGAYNGSRQSYKGFSLRVIPIYDGTNDISKWRLDVLYGRKVINNRVATRLSGT